MKKKLFNFKRISILVLFALVGASNVSGMAIDQKSVTDSKKSFKHITTYEKNGKDAHPYISGFHYYKVKPIIFWNGYLSVIDKDLWVYSPSDPDGFHYGYLFYKGELIKQKKTFFPSSMSEDNLNEILNSVVTYTNDELTRLKSSMPERLTVNIPSLKTKMQIKINRKKKITSVFPFLDGTDLDRDTEPGALESIRREQAKFDGLQSILITAAEQGNTEAVQHLIDCGAKVNPSNKEGEDTPLIAAVENGCIALVHLLLQNGAIVDYKDSVSNTALNCAASKGNVDIIRLLLGYGAAVNLQCDCFGNTALRDAVSNALTSGKLDTLKLLLDADANVNHRNNEGNTAFLSAIGANVSSYMPGHSFLKSCKCNGVAVIRLLLEHETDFAVTNNKGESAYDIAVRLNFDDDIIKLLSPQQASSRCTIC